MQVDELIERHKAGAIEGVYYDVPAEVYHHKDCPGVSNSRIGLTEDGFDEFKRRLDQPFEDTPDLIFGRAVHDAILLPEVFKNSYTKAPSFDRRTKGGKAGYQELMENFPHAVFLKEETFDAVLAIRDRFFANPVFRAIFSEGSPEVTFFWVDKKTGILCRCRVDWFREDGLMFDLKTTLDSSRRIFARSIADWKYDRQAAGYVQGVSQVMKKDYEFIFIPIEKKPPFKMKLFPLGPKSLATGLRIYENDLLKYISFSDHLMQNTKPEEEAISFETIEMAEWAHNLENRL